MTRADKTMNPQHLGTDLADIWIWINRDTLHTINHFILTNLLGDFTKVVQKQVSNE